MSSRPFMQVVYLTIVTLSLCLFYSKAVATEPASAPREYSICKTWQEVVEGENLHYAPVIRVSEPGTKEQPVYTGFWFFDCVQFDESGRYALAMKVDFQNREVTPSDRGE